MSSFTPAQAGYSRVFVIEGRARVDRAPSYQSCLKAGGLSRSFGDVEMIECPDPAEWGKWVEMGRVRGAKERATLTLTGRYAADVKSMLMRLARKGCAVDAQVNMGACDPPNINNKFTKKLILEDALLTNHETEDLGALASGDNAKVDESSELSIGDAYEVLPLSFAERAGSIITNEVMDGVICDAVSCGSCQEESGGCDKVYFVTRSAGGSAGTPADVIFSVDGGANWYAQDITALGTAVDAEGVACLGAYVVVIGANATYPMVYAEKSDLTPTSVAAWSVITTGFSASGLPQAIWSTGSEAFIVGTGGYIYGTTDPTVGVTLLDAGVATGNVLNAVHGLSGEFAIAVGNFGSIVKTEDGVVWTFVTPTNIAFGATSFNCVLVVSKTEWVFGTTAGRLYYTLDGGVTFYEKTFPGSGSGVVQDIVKSNASVWYMSHTTAAGRGRILRSYDAGYSWEVMPENVGTLPLNDRITALVACPNDPNLVYGGGLADNGADGIILQGQA